MELLQFYRNTFITCVFSFILSIQCAQKTVSLGIVGEWNGIRANGMSVRIQGAMVHQSKQQRAFALMAPAQYTF